MHINDWNTIVIIFKKLQFMVECLHGFFGQHCERRCGKCKGGMNCNTTSDMCPDGCQEHWSPPKCTGENKN